MDASWVGAENKVPLIDRVRVLVEAADEDHDLELPSALYRDLFDPDARFEVELWLEAVERFLQDKSDRAFSLVDAAGRQYWWKHAPEVEQAVSGYSDDDRLVIASLLLKRATCVGSVEIALHLFHELPLSAEVLDVVDLVGMTGALQGPASRLLAAHGPRFESILWRWARQDRLDYGAAVGGLVHTTDPAILQWLATDCCKELTCPEYVAADCARASGLGSLLAGDPLSSCGLESVCCIILGLCEALYDAEDFHTLDDGEAIITDFIRQVEQASEWTPTYAVAVSAVVDWLDHEQSFGWWTGCDFEHEVPRLLDRCSAILKSSRWVEIIDRSVVPEEQSRQEWLIQEAARVITAARQG